MPLPESRREIEELLAEAKYYLVQGLLEECQAALQVGNSSFPIYGAYQTSLPPSFPPCKMGPASCRHWETFCRESLEPAAAVGKPFLCHEDTICTIPPGMLSLRDA